MQEQPKTLPIKKILITIIAVLVIIVGLQAFSGINTRGRTGVLSVTSPQGTSVSISAQNKQAAVIGTGTVKVRVDPGTYLLMGIKNGSRTTTVVTVTKTQTTHTTLQFSANPNGIRSSQDITFQGQSGLLNVGLTVSQVNKIEQNIFEYKTTAKTVTINENTIEPGPHDPNGVAPFTLNFTLSIDGTSYTAVATYLDLENVDLQLTNATTGRVVFTSGAVQQTGGD
jgi:hypothetical protein